MLGPVPGHTEVLHQMANIEPTGWQFSYWLATYTKMTPAKEEVFIIAIWLHNNW